MYTLKPSKKTHPSSHDAIDLALILTWRQISVDLTIGRWWLIAHLAWGGLGGLSLWMVLYTITHYIWFCIPLSGWFRIPLYEWFCVPSLVTNIWFCTLDNISKKFLRNIWKKRNKRPNVGGVTIRSSSNGAPSRKGCVVNGQRIKASNKWVRPPPCPVECVRSLTRVTFRQVPRVRDVQ